jgi:hypothetical protein
MAYGERFVRIIKESYIMRLRAPTPAAFEYPWFAPAKSLPPTPIR